ncbi:sensor histidine kinase [Parapedobacter sp. 10938]|uniref:sensor histidine kinase n=1 Tax=Parapedobacter flavus TaxID=3110225 RepID=UPI002DB56C82|nr:ATP-binding protein [Parapedobacter sp. 10938]MEC3879132.1 ATP-binding protein [Parapedobacter sp. 10938]
MDDNLYVQISKSSLIGIVIVGTLTMLLCLASVWLITTLYERKRLLFEEKAKRQASEYEFMLQAARTQEAEHILSEVAAALHDHLGNKMALLVTILGDMRNLHRQKKDLGADGLQLAQDLAEEIWENARGLNRIIEGESLLEKGLIHAVRTDVAQMQHLEGLTVNLHTDTTRFEAFELDTLLHIRRIIQESAFNAIKHAKASTITLSITAVGNTAVQVDVVDDGCGFDTTAVDSAASLGLSNMRFRAETIGGNLYIKSKPGSGTRISLRVPTATVP